MKTLNSEPRIEINWTPGAWAGYAYAAPTLKAADFNLAMAMAELRSVAAERDRAVTSLMDAGFTLADGAERWKPPVNERMGEIYRRLFSLTDERDKLKLTESFAVAGWNKAVIERDSARQSLRAAEQEVAETDSVNSDLRTVNARLVADLAAAMERLNHAESIIMQ
jgi:cob(I)alamin adenosyltransferase